MPKQPTVNYIYTFGGPLSPTVTIENLPLAPRLVNASGSATEVAAFLPRGAICAAGYGYGAVVTDAAMVKGPAAGEVRRAGGPLGNPAVADCGCAACIKTRASMKRGVGHYQMLCTAARGPEQFARATLDDKAWQHLPKES
ncbi:hypothetical protein Vretimale_4386 [Volvox reticuliferus]|uniref:Uncharacterized protein n=1 Tax=Volvox reticuliferus TaxID=1737510 RepID=A0A8J4FFC1_9CHLO|nr:hypothetical protein Vretifemale_2979 [Volvox reticuliferus]GIL99123.1 hypothetical protein Vretimale_4386 [Volvox reticuliferus]